MKRLVLLSSIVFTLSVFAAPFRSVALDITGVDVDDRQMERVRKIKLLKPFGVFDSATVFATTNGVIKQIRCIHEYSKNLKPEEIIPDYESTQKLVAQKFEVATVVNERDKTCYLRRTIHFKNTKWCAHLYISESTTQGNPHGRYYIDLTFLR